MSRRRGRRRRRGLVDGGRGYPTPRHPKPAPAVVRVHKDEKDVPLAYGPGTEIIVTDDDDDRSVLPPGQRFADTPNLDKFWGGGTPSL